MNAEDQFERRLQGQPLRPLPAPWREEILEAARAAAPRSIAPERSLSSWAAVADRLHGLLWPHPRAWAGLAALWLVILGLSLLSREPARQDLANRSFRPSLQTRELLREQEQLLAELVGPLGSGGVERRKSEPTGPRSQRQAQFMNS